jgi:hypothetical protein
MTRSGLFPVLRTWPDSRRCRIKRSDKDKDEDFDGEPGNAVCAA